MPDQRAKTETASDAGGRRQPGPETVRMRFAY